MMQYFDFWMFLAGLGVFLFGLHAIEQSLKNLTGRSFKKFLRNHTTNPIKGVLGGAGITAILQSSSVVSLMVMAFVGAGIINMRSALGLVFGSNLPLFSLLMQRNCTVLVASYLVLAYCSLVLTG